VDLLDCPIKSYDWGSPTALAGLQGRRPTGEPEAELWIGAHPSGPAHLVRGGRRAGLDEVIAADPVAELGAEAAARWQGRLPFLLKLLAAARPLSLQTHPSSEQAVSGFAAEEAAGVPIDAPQRLFRDTNHKPELICALTPFTALCGFRAVETTLDLLDGIGDADLGAELVSILAAEPGPDGLRRAMVTALQTSTRRARPAVAAVGARAAHGVPGFEAECRWLSTLADRHPGDPAVFVAAMLELVVLQPGQALFLTAGTLHSYLDGLGVELMANSDNVLRGGLTSKHVDVDALARIVITEPAPPPVQTADAGVFTYRSSVPEFALTRYALLGERATLPSGPAAGVAVNGSFTLEIDGTPHAVGSGRAVWIPASDGSRALSGTGIFFLATEGTVGL
jgi:mannose-6-phosphate isomerase